LTKDLHKTIREIAKEFNNLLFNICSTFKPNWKNKKARQISLASECMKKHQVIRRYKISALFCVIKIIPLLIVLSCMKWKVDFV